MIATQLCPLYTYYRGCDAEVQKGEIEFLAHTTSTTNEINMISERTTRLWRG
jgi:hypothetical protein